MVVPGEIAHRQQVNAGLLLLIPVASAQFAANSQQFFAAGIARPVALLRFFQLATQANARETEGVINNCHFFEPHNFNPKDFGFREGGKLAHPQELTEVSDWGEEVRPTHHKFER